MYVRPGVPLVGHYRGHIFFFLFCGGGGGTRGATVREPEIESRHGWSGPRPRES